MGSLIWFRIGLGSELRGFKAHGVGTMVSTDLGVVRMGGVVRQFASCFWRLLTGDSSCERSLERSCYSFTCFDQILRLMIDKTDTIRAEFPYEVMQAFFHQQYNFDGALIDR